MALAVRAAAAPPEDRVALAIRYADALTGDDRGDGGTARDGAPSAHAAADDAWNGDGDGEDEDEDDCDLEDESPADRSPRAGRGDDARDRDGGDAAERRVRWAVSRCEDGDRDSVDDELDDLVDGQGSSPSDRRAGEQPHSSRLSESSVGSAGSRGFGSSDRDVRTGRTGYLGAETDRDIPTSWPIDLLAIARRVGEGLPEHLRDAVDADTDVGAVDEFGVDESESIALADGEVDDDRLTGRDGDDAGGADSRTPDRGAVGDGLDGSGAIAMLDAELDPGDTTAGLDAADAMATAGAAEQYERSLRRGTTSAIGRIDLGVSWRRRWSAPMHSSAYRADEIWLVATWRQ